MPLTQAAYSGTVSNQTQPVKQTQVQSEVSRSGNLIEELTRNFKILEDKLSPILRDAPNSPQGKLNSEKMILVGHAMAISNQNDQIESLCAEVEGLISRLEL